MGTPFIIIIFGIIVVCIAMAIVVASLMRTNDALDSGEQGQAGATGEVDEIGAHPLTTGNLGPHGSTGPLPPFGPLAHRTQPLSEIYYYDEQFSGPLPAVPLPHPDMLNAPAPQPDPAGTLPPPLIPPTGPSHNH